MSSTPGAMRLRLKHPDHVPVLCAYRQVDGSKKKTKLLVPTSMMWSAFLPILRMRVPGGDSPTANFLLGGTAPDEGFTLKKLDEKYRDSQGYLNIDLVLFETRTGDAEAVEANMREDASASAGGSRAKSRKKAQHLRAKYPDRIPVHCTFGDTLPKKFLMRSGLTCRELQPVLRKYAPPQGPFSEEDWVSVDFCVSFGNGAEEVISRGEELISNLYDRCQGDDGLLHIFLRPNKASAIVHAEDGKPSSESDEASDIEKNDGEDKNDDGECVVGDAAAEPASFDSAHESDQFGAVHYHIGDDEESKDGMLLVEKGSAADDSMLETPMVFDAADSVVTSDGNDRVAWAAALTKEFESQRDDIEAAAREAVASHVAEAQHKILSLEQLLSKAAVEKLCAEAANEVANRKAEVLVAELAASKEAALRSEEQERQLRAEVEGLRLELGLSERLRTEADASLRFRVGRQRARADAMEAAMQIHKRKMESELEDAKRKVDAAVLKAVTVEIERKQAQEQASTLRSELDTNAAALEEARKSVLALHRALREAEELVENNEKRATVAEAALLRKEEEAQALDRQKVASATFDESEDGFLCLGHSEPVCHLPEDEDGFMRL